MSPVVCHPPTDTCHLSTIISQPVIAAPQQSVVTTLWEDSDSRLMLCNAKIRFAPAAVTALTLAKQSNSNNNNDNDMKGPSTVTTDDSPSSEQKHNERLPLPPSSSSSSSSSSSGGRAWQQFLHYHHLAPCRILVAGASGSGKSALAKELAKEYELQYVDVLDTLRWVASSNNSSNSSSSGGDETSSSSSSAATATVAASAAAADVKKALLDIMTAKLQEGVKKGAPPVICDPLTFDYTESLVALVPLPLVRKSLALRISTCPHCKIKGFVLDVWHVSDLVGDVNDFVELLNLNNNNNDNNNNNNNNDNNNHNSFQLSGSDPTSMVVTGGETGTGPLSELGTTVKVETDVIVVELDSGDKVGGAPPSSMCPPCAHVQSYLSIPLTPSLSHLLTSPLSPLLISPPPSHTPPSHHLCSHPSPQGPSSRPVHQVFGSLGIGQQSEAIEGNPSVSEGENDKQQT